MTAPCQLRIPGVCLGRATNTHHRRPRQMGGSRDPVVEDPANHLHLCGDGVRGCHGYVESHRAEAYEKGWLVHSWEDPREVPWSPADE